MAEQLPKNTLVKEGASPLGLGQRALAAGGLGGVGLGIGGLAGALLGGVRGARRAKEEGTSGVSGALRGALGGASKGALLGGLGGAVVGGLGGKATQQLSSSLGGDVGALGAFNRFGQRQAYSLTGALPEGMSAAKGKKLLGLGQASGLREQAAREASTGASKEQVSKLLRAAKAHAAAENMGLDNVPGFFKSLASKPADTLKTLAAKEWHGSPSVAGKLLTVGLPAAALAGDAFGPTGEGRTRAGNILGGAGSALGFMAPLPLAGQAVASGLLGGAGRRMGNLIGPKGARPANPGPEPELSGTESTSAPHVYSQRMTGDFA